MHLTYQMDHELAHDLELDGLTVCKIAADAEILIEDGEWTCTTIAIAWDRCAAYEGTRELCPCEMRQRLLTHQNTLIDAVAHEDRRLDGLDDWARAVLQDQEERYADLWR